MPNQIQLKVYSRWTETEEKTGLGPPTNRIQYLPWGTRSLKLEVTGNYKGDLTIAPENRSEDADIIAGYANGPSGQAILISWGGGWEKGVELKRNPGQTNYVFFNITHQGQSAADTYLVDLVAHDKWGDEIGRLQVTLQRPPLPNLSIKSEWRTLAPGVEELHLITDQEGAPAYVPIYLSRWWPEAWISYVSPDLMGVPPHIYLRCQSNVKDGFSKVEIWGKLSESSPNVQLATIDGDIQFPVVDLHQIRADLFFIAGHWALRTWFFWLDKGVANRLNRSGLGQNELAALERWREEQEIPDAERADLVFDKNLRVKYLCTDLHWHEMWAPNKGMPVHISIAGEKLNDVLIRGSVGIRVIAAARAKSYIPEPEHGFDPSKQVMKILADPNRVDLGGGTLKHKHTPFFHDVEFDADLTSSDVLSG